MNGLQGMVHHPVTSANTSMPELAKQKTFEKIELLGGGGEIAQAIAERAEGRSPEVFEVGFAVAKEAGGVREEGQGSSGMEGDADQFREIDGVDVLVDGVEAKKESRRGRPPGVDGMVGVGEGVACERNNDLGPSRRKDALAGVGGVRIVGIPEGMDERNEGGMGNALKVKHGIGLKGLGIQIWEAAWADICIAAIVGQ